MCIEGTLALTDDERRVDVRVDLHERLHDPNSRVVFFGHRADDLESGSRVALLEARLEVLVQIAVETSQRPQYADGW